MIDEPEVLLDTHILVWAREDPTRLTKPQRDVLKRIETKEGRVAISAITLWEIGMMAERKALRTKASIPALLSEIESNPWVEVLPINAAVAAESMTIRLNLKTDPADHMIVASARVFRLPLLTSDKRIIDSKLAIIV